MLFTISGKAMEVFSSTISFLRHLWARHTSIISKFRSVSSGDEEAPKQAKSTRKFLELNSKNSNKHIEISEFNKESFKCEDFDKGKKAHIRLNKPWKGEDFKRQMKRLIGYWIWLQQSNREDNKMTDAGWRMAHREWWTQSREKLCLCNIPVLEKDEDETGEFVGEGGAADRETRSKQVRVRSHRRSWNILQRRVRDPEFYVWNRCVACESEIRRVKQREMSVLEESCVGVRWGE